MWIRTRHGGDRVDHTIGVSFQKKHVQRVHIEYGIIMVSIMLTIVGNRMVFRHVFMPIRHQTRQRRLPFNVRLRHVRRILRANLIIVHNLSERSQRMHRGFHGRETGRTPFMPLVAADRNQWGCHDQRHT